MSTASSRGYQHATTRAMTIATTTAPISKPTSHIATAKGTSSTAAGIPATTAITLRANLFRTAVAAIAPMTAGRIAPPKVIPAPAPVAAIANSTVAPTSAPAPTSSADHRRRTTTRTITNPISAAAVEAACRPPTR